MKKSIKIRIKVVCNKYKKKYQKGSLKKGRNGLKKEIKL